MPEEPTDEIVLTESHLIICEGGADESFFKHLLPAHGLGGFQVEVPIGGGGVNKYRHFLNALPLQRGYDQLSTITLVGDNDLSHRNPFHRLQQEIKEAHAGYPVPINPMVLARSDTHPNVVAFLVPWADERGNLESLILQAFSAEWPEIRRAANQYLDASPAKTWTADEQAIMLLQCMIAAICKKDPHCSLRYIWSQSVFRDLIGHPTFERVAGFFQTLAQMA